MCYWLEEEGAMLLGDHVLFDITPNITNWEGVDDSLGNYLDSLRAIRAYDVALPLPGHRGRGAFRARIDDLLAHHEHRLAEALEVVKKYPGNTAYFLAGHMTWKIRANSWEEFPLAQKWFAVGECASHMDYLKRRDLIREEPDGEGLLRYYPC
jgi:glyoxylase-like metal-dependent hydrolase (beta-lactamase superfamily II)